MHESKQVSNHNSENFQLSSAFQNLEAFIISGHLYIRALFT